MDNFKSEEDKILNLIECVQKNPYAFSVRHLSSMFLLSQEKILKLIESLNLEVIGHEIKNTRRQILKFIEHNPGLTVKQIAKEIECSEYLVYSVGKKIAYRFETEYSMRAKRNIEVL